jgi:GGDEF domain-containing protein
MDPKKIEPISLIIEDYAEWFSRIVKSSFYHDKKNSAALEAPKSFIEWLTTTEKNDQLDGAIIERLKQTHAYLLESAQKMLSSSTTPEVSVFDFFMQSYESFISRLIRFEIDILYATTGVDQDTGFRTGNILLQDLTREMDRRSRRGSPFSLCLTRIDGDWPDEKLRQHTKIAASSVQACIRSFDDVYRLNKNEFLISLKQTDNKGALKFVDRLNRELKKNAAPFLMSSCVAEPIPGDDINELIDNIRKDLDRMIEKGQGGAGEYEDVSPLARFVNAISRGSDQ